MLFALLSLCACSVSGIMPEKRASSQPVHLTVAFAAAAPAPAPAREGIEISSIVRSAMTIPAEVERLRHAVVIACAAVAGVGVLNAFLLLRLLGARRRSEIPPAPAAPAVARVSCGCGAPISPRTKSGRCRPCALAHRRAASAGVALQRSSVSGDVFEKTVARAAQSS